MNYLGVDVHLNDLVIAEIDENMNIGLLEKMNIERFLSYIENKSFYIVAVDAPYKLNMGLMNNNEYRKSLGLNKEIHFNKKVSEYELSRRGIIPFSTPDSIQVVKAKAYLSWMETGFKVYKSLEKCGYQLLSKENFQTRKNKGMIEVFPHASFTVLANRILLNKNTSEGIHERIEILEECGFKNISKLILTYKRADRDDFIDALIAAHTAFNVFKGECMFVGDMQEGQIALPSLVIKDKYKKNLTKVAIVEKEYQTSCSYRYEVLHCDSVLWLKHFVPLDNSPDIKELLKAKYNKKIHLTLTNYEKMSVNAVFVNMNGGAQGLKSAEEYKNTLKSFWGVHGDNKKYIVTVNNIESD